LRDAPRARRDVDRREPRRVSRGAGNATANGRGETAKARAETVASARVESANPPVETENARGESPARARAASTANARGETAMNARGDTAASTRGETPANTRSETAANPRGKSLLDAPANELGGPRSTETSQSAQGARSGEVVEGAPARESDVAADARADLRAELELLARAEAALRRNDPRSALQELDAHDHQFRSGQLRDEREGLRLIAQCNLARDPGASLARYLQDYGDGVLHARVRAACARFLP
jgi:hypothetical protein